MYDGSYSIPQGLHKIQYQQARNIYSNPYLPIINTRQQILEEEQYKHVQNSLNYINNRAQRSLKFISRHNNFPMYDPGMYNLVHHFPQNLFNYRPIRYFFQRPVYYDTSQPEVRQIVAERNADDFVAQTMNKATKGYAIPLKYEDLIKNGEVLNQALAKVIDPQEVNNQLKDIERHKNELIIRKENELYGLKDKVNKKRMAAGERIKKLSKKIRMYMFFRVYIKFSLSLKYIKSNEETIIQTAKNSLDELTRFAVSLLKNKNLLSFLSKSLRNKLVLGETKSKPLNTKDKIQNKAEVILDQSNTNVEYLNNLKTKDKKPNSFFQGLNENKDGKLQSNNKDFINNTSEERVDNSIFNLKTTIHNLMNTITNSISKSEDIPLNVHKAFKNFIFDGAIIPKGFLTTLEFNRLEWSLRIKLIRMNTEKKAMMICTVFLFRVIVMNILMNFLKYFPEFKVVNDPGIPDIISNFDYNFKLIGTILAKIFKESIPKPAIYKEFFKEKYLFKYYLIENAKSADELLKFDQFELENILPVFKEGEEFIVNNYKWSTLYKLSTSSFCMNMVDLIR